MTTDVPEAESPQAIVPLDKSTDRVRTLYFTVANSDKFKRRLRRFRGGAVSHDVLIQHLSACVFGISTPPDFGYAIQNADLTIALMVTESVLASASHAKIGWFAQATCSHELIHLCQQINGKAMTKELEHSTSNKNSVKWKAYVYCLELEAHWLASMNILLIMIGLVSPIVVAAYLYARRKDEMIAVWDWATPYFDSVIGIIRKIYTVVG
jgi:hypothetical protein